MRTFKFKLHRDRDLRAPPRLEELPHDTGLRRGGYELALACVNQALKNQSPIGAAKDRLTRPLRVGHKTGHIPSLIANSRDVVERTIGIGGFGGFALGINVAPEDLVVRPEPRER